MACGEAQPLTRVRKKVTMDYYDGNRTLEMVLDDMSGDVKLLWEYEGQYEDTPIQKWIAIPLEEFARVLERGYVPPPGPQPVEVPAVKERGTTPGAYYSASWSGRDMISFWFVGGTGGQSAFEPLRVPVPWKDCEELWREYRSRAGSSPTG
jgi:hypothetical protein